MTLTSAFLGWIGSFLAFLAMSFQLLTSGEVLEMKRGGCIGRCAAFDLTVLKDGGVKYRGWENVKETGTRDGQISPADLAAIKAGIFKAHFWALKRFYSSPRTDGPYTRLCVGGELGRCVEFGGGEDVLLPDGGLERAGSPRELEDLTSAIDQLPQVDAWLRP